MMIGLALGWLLGIGTAILLLQFAAAALADDQFEDLTDVGAPPWPQTSGRRRHRAG